MKSLLALLLLAQVVAPRLTFLRLTTTPPGARIYDQSYSEQAPEHGLLGRTPLTLPLDRNQSQVVWVVRQGYRPERLVLPALPQNQEVSRTEERSVRLTPADTATWIVDLATNRPELAYPGLALLMLLVGGAVWLARSRFNRLESELWDALLRDPELVGKRIDQYLVVGKLGEGAYSTVYLVEHTDFQESYALKMLKSEISNPTNNERMFREMRLSQGITHPALVRTVAFGDYQGRPYLVMERVRGVTLQQALTSRNWSTHQILDILIQAAQGLGALHKHGIIHRDIKPDNFLVDECNRLRILDLGSAKWTELGRLTASGTALGTPLYMSPEHFNSRDLDQRSDIYSLGVVAFYALTHTLPFQGEDTMTVLAAHLTMEAPPLRQLRPDLPPELEAIVARMLAKQAQHRYACMEDVAAALTEQLERIPV